MAEEQSSQDIDGNLNIQAKDGSHANLNAPTAHAATTIYIGVPPNATPLGTPVVPSTAENSPLPISTFPIRNIPYSKNPYFTGREHMLLQLRDALQTHSSQALTGLGGIGKTQLAIAYAYQYQEQYQAVFWVKADFHETIVSDYITIAELLELPGRNVTEQDFAVNAVKRWLETHSDWLLIFDNANDLRIVKEFLPFMSKGHILLTTQSHPVGTLAQRFEISEMSPEVGATFLLRRSGRLLPNDPLESATSGNIAVAQSISNIMGGLPLGLEQAGAYIEETGSSLPDYLQLFQEQHGELLDWQSELNLNVDPQKTVMTTLSLSTHKVEQASNSAAELLRFFSFLHPDTISIKLISKGNAFLKPELQEIASNPFKLNKAIGELLKYSLVSNTADTETLTMHRLVQTVLKDGMDVETQYLWIERVIKLVNQALSEIADQDWQGYESLIPHIKVCASLIEQWNMTFSEAVHLLDKAGNYLFERGRYIEAESLMKQTLGIREKTLGLEHPDVAQSLNSLSELNRVRGKYPEAIPLCERALTIREKTLGLEHPDVAQSLNSLARLYHHQGDFHHAESLYQQSLTIREKVLGSEHPDTAQSLNDLAVLCNNQARYAEVESLFKRALAIREKVLGPEHPDTASSLSSQAALYKDQEKYPWAQQKYHEALAIYEKVFGSDHPTTASSIYSLAEIYQKQGNRVQAEQLYKRALSIYRRIYSSEYPTAVIISQRLGALSHQNTGKKKKQSNKKKRR